MIQTVRSAWGERMSIDNRLAELGISLPQPAAPVASYVPAVESGGLLHISGQISFAEDGSLIKGRLGEDTITRGTRVVLVEYLPPRSVIVTPL